MTESRRPFVEIRPLKDRDLQTLADRLRPMDRLEVAAMASDRPVADVLLEAGRSCLRGRAGFCDGDLVACWGITPRTTDGLDGAPWLLATDALDRMAVRRAFLAHGKHEMHKLTDGCRHLWNLVHRDNALARRWLRIMGFEFRDAREYVFSGEAFVKFEMGYA